MAQTVYVGTFIHSVSPTELEICEHGVIGVDGQGAIAFVEKDAYDGQRISEKYGWVSPGIILAQKEEFFFPGFIGMPTVFKLLQRSYVDRSVLPP